MKNFYNYLLFWVLVMITLPFIFVSEVNADQWIESNVYESVDGPFGRGTQSYTNRCTIPWSLSQPNINDRATYTIDPSKNSWNFYCTPGNEFNIGTVTDNQGNVTTEVTQLYTTDFRYHVDRYDIDAGLHTDKYIRYEFIMRVYGATYLGGSFPTITDSNLVNKYLSTFMVSPVYNQCSVKFGFNNNPNDLGVSCLIGPGEDLNFVMSNMTNQNTAYRVTTGNFQMVLGFNITQPSIVWSNDITGLQYGSSGSVLGNFFNTDYQKIQSNSNSFLSSISLPGINDLTSIITSPLRILDSSQFRPYSYVGNLNFTIFGKNIILNSGNRVLWSRPSNGYLKIGNWTCNGDCINQKVADFKTFWNWFAGGIIIFLLGKRAVLMTISLLDPTSKESEVESF